MKAAAQRILPLAFCLWASGAAAQKPYPGDAVLELADKDYAAATEQMVRERLYALMEHLQIDVHTRARLLVNVAAMPKERQAARHLVKSKTMLTRPETTMAVIVAKNDVVLSTATDTVVIAGGNVKISFASNALVVAGGSIVVAHDGVSGGSGMYVTRDRLQISHGAEPIVYALRGVSVPAEARLTAYNTDVSQTMYGVVTHLTRPPIFAGEYARRPVEDSMSVSSGPEFAYTGSRCGRAVSEQAIEKVVRQAEVKNGCTSIESVNVVCVAEASLGSPSIERWTVRLCGKSEVYEARLSGAGPAPRPAGTGAYGALSSAGAASGTIAAIAPGADSPNAGGGYRAAPRSTPALQALFKSAMEAANTGERGRAIELYGRIISAEPNYWAAYVNRGALRARQGDVRGGIEDYTSVIDLGYGNAEIYSMRGLLWLKTGDSKRGVEDLNAAVEKGAGVTALFNRGTAYLDIGNPQRAVTDFSRVIERSPRYPPAYEMRMWAALLAGADAYADAALRMSLIESAPKSDPRVRAAYAVVGGYLALRMKARDDQAQEWLARWRGELRAEAWPDALALHWLGDADLGRARATAAAASQVPELDAFLGLQALAVADRDSARRHFDAVLARDASGLSLARGIALAKSAPVRK